MYNENEALLFDEATGGARPTGVEAAPKGPGALLETSETKPQQSGGAPLRQGSGGQAPSGATAGAQAISPNTYEIVAWANAIRCGTPLACGAENASHSASWTIAANEAMKTGQMVKIL
jgi:hypothetical protein